MIRKLLVNFLKQFPSVAFAYRNLRDEYSQRQLALKTPWGFTLAGHPAMAGGNFEPEETKLVRRLMCEVEILVNVGANIGYYCCHALSMGKPVIAVEPNVNNLRYLLKNIHDNNWAEQAEIFPVAVGDSVNILQMWGGGTGASLIKGWASIPESYVTRVPLLTLDRLLGDSLRGKRALILVDVEGAEYMMLQGAMRTLNNAPRPIWIMEISITEHQPAGTIVNPRLLETFDMFFDNGYRAVTADASASEISKADVLGALQGKQQLSTHNFVFRHV